MTAHASHQMNHVHLMILMAATQVTASGGCAWVSCVSWSEGRTAAAAERRRQQHVRVVPTAAVRRPRVRLSPLPQPARTPPTAHRPAGAARSPHAARLAALGTNRLTAERDRTAGTLTRSEWQSAAGCEEGSH